MREIISSHFSASSPRFREARENPLGVVVLRFYFSGLEGRPYAGEREDRIPRVPFDSGEKLRDGIEHFFRLRPMQRGVSEKNHRYERREAGIGDRRGNSPTPEFIAHPLPALKFAARRIMPRMSLGVNDDRQFDGTSGAARHAVAGDSEKPLDERPPLPLRHMPPRNGENIHVTVRVKAAAFENGRTMKMNADEVVHSENLAHEANDVIGLTQRIFSRITVRRARFGRAATRREARFHHGRRPDHTRRPRQRRFRNVHARAG